MKYSENYQEFNTQIINLIHPEFAIYLHEAITDKKSVNIADKLPRFIFSDAELSGTTLHFYIENSEDIEIDISLYDIKQSHSVPKEFYFELKTNSKEYFVIIFEC